MNLLFSKSQLKEQFSAEGFITTDVLFDGRQLSEIESLLQPFIKPFQGELFFSLFENNPGQNLQIAQLLKPFIESIAARYCLDYRVNTPSFLIKPPFTMQELKLHQDWNYVDENLWQSATIWMPLRGATPENGCLFVLPGSHRWHNNHRSPSLETARLPLTPSLVPFIKTLEIKAGQAVMFHPALFHGSYPNKSERQRVVVTAVLLPSKAPFVHYQYNNEGMGICEYALPEDALMTSLKELSRSEIPPGATLLRTLPLQYLKPDEKDLIEHAGVKDTRVS